VRTLLIVAYIVLTVAGLFVFRGIPILNVALGFPLGAAAARRAGGTLPALQATLAWAMTGAAITMAACWLELAGLLFVAQHWGPFSAAALWVPLQPPPDATSISRVVLYAVIIAPALQVLTTAFGGLITVLLTQQAVKRGN
jgi:hypothetical protein